MKLQFAHIFQEKQKNKSRSSGKSGRGMRPFNKRWPKMGERPLPFPAERFH